MDNSIPQDKIDDIVKRARQLETDNSGRNRLFKRYRDIYFMDNIDRPKNGGVDKNDWKITPSPSGRNEVTGMKRLLDTSEMQVKVLEGKKSSRNSDKIEAALKKILDVSSEGKQARVESDAMLSAVLYGPVILAAESVQDSLTVKGIPEYKRLHLLKQQKRSPFIIRTINPEEHFAERDEGLMILHMWKYQLLGSKIKSRFGGEEAKDNTEYTVRDIFTPEYHVVVADGINKPLFAGAHGLNCIPVVSSYAGGTDLFHKPEEQINSFLYAKAKAELDKRENSVYTALFTAIHVRGLLGPLVAVDPETTPETIEVSYQGGIRIMKAKATPIDDKVIDPVIFQAKQLLDELSGQSTIHAQVTGGNADGVGTFSGLAMLSSAGKLPMIDSQRALQATFRDIFLHILYRIKNEVIENELIAPNEIPDDVDLEVTFTPKLPQDSLRNAQVASQLGDKVSDEWIHTNLLQVNDTPAMQKQIAKEQIKKALLAGITQNPQIMEQLMAAVIGQPKQQPQAPQPQGGQPDMSQQMPPEGMPPEMMEQMQQGGGMPMQPGMEQMPQTEPMIPPQERM